MKRLFITFNLIFTILYTISASEPELINRYKNAITFSTGFSKYECPSISFSYLLNKTWFNIGLGFNGSYDRAGAIYNDTQYRYQHDEFQHYLISSIGLEKRKMINDKLEFDYGFDLLLQYGLRSLYIADPNKPESLRTTNYSNSEYGIDFNFGLYYNLSDQFSIGSRLTPYIWFQWIKEGKYFRTSFDLTNHSFLSLRYRF